MSENPRRWVLNAPRLPRFSRLRFWWIVKVRHRRKYRGVFTD